MRHMEMQLSGMTLEIATTVGHATIDSPKYVNLGGEVHGHKRQHHGAYHMHYHQHAGGDAAHDHRSDFWDEQIRCYADRMALAVPG